MSGPTEFTDQLLRDARFTNVDLHGARFHNVDLREARLRGVWMTGAEIDGEVGGLVVNGVEVGPLVEAELDRRDPDRRLLHLASAEDFRAGYAMVCRRWDETVERARRLPPELLHERVEGEWSFVETLRHLVFATDAWILRALLGDPSPYDPLGLPHDEMEDLPGVPRDRDVRPDLDTVLAVRADRRERLRKVYAGLTDDALDEQTEVVAEPGYPESESFTVRRCVRCIVLEEWHHRTYAERDLAVLEQRVGAS